MWNAFTSVVQLGAQGGNITYTTSSFGKISELTFRSLRRVIAPVRVRFLRLRRCQINNPGQAWILYLVRKAGIEPARLLVKGF